MSFHSSHPDIAINNQGPKSSIGFSKVNTGASFFSIPQIASVNEPQSTDSRHQLKRVKVSEEDEDTQFLFGAVNQVLQEGQNIGLQASPPLSSMQARSKIQSGAIDRPIPSVSTPKQSSVHLQDITPFLQNEKVLQMVGSESGKASSRKKKHHKDNNSELSSKAAEIPPPQSEKLLSLESIDSKTLPWGDLVRNTMMHPKYQKDYSFSDTDYTWVDSKDGVDKKVYPLIAIDCEMCQTQDPVTGELNHNSLIRVSVINGLDPTQVTIVL